ncbi:MAG: 16S rRNA processing protein RimM [Clostridiales bacterium GWE2_32_10]|nr:MAG: 16S rRNA processing protein RimM [Clostridiales bacterium GWE2_32_10]
MDKYFLIGKVVNTQGLKGDVRVVPSTYDKHRFELLDYILLENPADKSRVKYNIDKVWYNKTFVILKLEGVNDIAIAERLKNLDIVIPEELGSPLEDDEYYIRDLYDTDVYDENGEMLGKIVDILSTGSNDVYIIENKEKGELLIPAIKECIKQVDIENRKMIIHVMEGLEWQ